MSTTGMHLELNSNLSKEEYKECFKRFNSKCGKPNCCQPRIKHPFKTNANLISKEISDRRYFTKSKRSTLSSLKVRE